jgi:hypothetical protein
MGHLLDVALVATHVIASENFGRYSVKKLHFGSLRQTEHRSLPLLTQLTRHGTDSRWAVFHSRARRRLSAEIGDVMGGRKRQMTMEQAITILRASGWRIDVDEAIKSIILCEPCPNVNWLHLLRPEHGHDDGQDGRMFN